MILMEAANDVVDESLALLEQRTSKMYDDVLTPLGQDYHIEILTPRQPKAGKPTILFLGNHSSGKSTFINFLLGETVQKTGIAPTDDGFTVIAHGNQEEQSTGPAAARRSEITVTELERFGPAFMARLKLKLLDNEQLRSMTLVDSPGMIDAATTAQARGYDFMSAVRRFGESADLILFFLDPEKPGTTGETIAAFTNALSGMESKTLILMNKADTFDHIRDFARDYGALCWNLSRVINTKDLPDIYTTFIPLTQQANQRVENRAIPLQGFDEAREDVLQQIGRSLHRRYDNVIGTLTEQAERLDMHVRVVWAVKKRVLRAQTRCVWITFSLLAGTAAATWFARDEQNRLVLAGLVGGGLFAALLVWIAGRSVIRRVASQAYDGLDALFEEIYERDLTLSPRDDLRIRWKAVKSHLEGVLRSMGIASFPSGNPAGTRRYRKLQDLLNVEIGRLRTKE